MVLNKKTKRRNQRIVDLARKGMNSRDIAKRVKISQTLVSRMLRRYYAKNKKTPFHIVRKQERTKRILKLRKKGVSIRKIAETLGIGAHTAWMTVKQRNR
ncbi:MAG: hypothetical protein A2268_16390 [Candidatus Raymondbacteria bacterium RifOxyA12_full_50_37]|uniref:Paired domain-containing protein n=1 Tax=Candidatus Raymondbacteria bacterium RIFOXYD12_FULL_49_13 TaxID=1817890 RepID=A0A1F7F801_UNCRA|nr:MAG: hypothetical protein A2268_16390 [Candidatus Raymondbacteria bacterium RifOxyA12_full_50_37]OGJ94377.1 MAG: hypothetical protein A2248_14585 [Candidatus Raymondbacteria bacterium RIFOXYA2_FULL_49_16]OGJ95138.1 MAG: hypothetical protein A2350_09340 [Candidatus Raymondbacteria bacterium RifOxyB12_full_50_8]OGJ95319.1 MAG: hypothetical protein A2453_06010 [Candidatus Raymondbacteria bacterium RIFOXYC2_FULL_50_21]OGJ99795.1 MAG: hypothetical protein A2487_10680 [Candidatus Raymondbacteria b